MNANTANVAVANLNAWFANDCREAAMARDAANKCSNLREEFIREEFNVAMMRYGALNRMITKARIDENAALENAFVAARHEVQLKIADLLDKAFATIDAKK